MTTPDSTGSTKKQILIVEDHPMTRMGLINLINGESDLHVCGEAESAATGLDAVIACKPDLVITDISLPGKSGLELLKDIHAVNPNIPMLTISMHAESIYAERALHAGSRGYIMKSESGDRILNAIRTVLTGQIYVSEKISSQILENVSGRSSSPKTGVDGLSDREFEIFQLMGKGLSTQQIATRLHLSSKTVDSHRARIKTKLATETMAELIAMAASWVEHEMR